MIQEKEYTLDEIKAMTDPELERVCTDFGIPLPDLKTKDPAIRHMFLLDAIKKHFGYDRKRKSRQRRRVSQVSMMKELYEGQLVIIKQQREILSLLRED